MNIFLLSTGPFVLLFIAVGLRLIVALQPDNRWSGRTRYTLMVLSFMIAAISLFGMLFLVFSQGPPGVFGFLMAIAFFMSMVETEVRFAGVRNRSRQVELLWVLASAVKAGRPLADEVESYAQGTWGKRHRALMHFADNIRDGANMSELVVPQGLLPESALMQIHAGITSKSLEQALQTAAHRMTRELAEDHESEFPGVAIAYPPTVMVLIAIIVAFVLYYIIPKFKLIYEDFGTRLPDFTIAMIRLADAFVNYWFAIGLPILVYLPVGICVLVGFAEYYGWQSLLKSTFGRFFVRWHTSDVLRALAQSLSQGIPIDQALTPLMKYAGPALLRKRLSQALDEIDDGSPSWQSLEKFGILNQRETVVLEMAEQTGNLPWAMNSLALHIDRVRVYRIRAFLEFVQPAMILPMGLFVGLFATAFFLPLIKLLNDLS